MQFETWFEQDLKKPIRVQYMKSTFFTLDSDANLIGVRVFDGGSPATLSGAVSATVIRPDNQTVPIAGEINGNAVSVVLPQAAYAFNGQFSIVIKVTDGSEVTTVCAAVGTIFRSETEAVVDPGTLITDINALIAQIEEAVESIPLDYSDLVEEVSDLENTVDQIENEVFTEINLVDTSDWVHASSSNPAITNNNDGTFTFDTSDYGTTVWQTSENVPAGDYVMCGVPYGFIVVSPTTSYSSGYIKKNSTNDPAEFTNPSNQKLYLVARSNSRPSSDYTVAPYIKTKTGNLVHIMQGVENAGKALIVGEDGKVIPGDVSIEVDDTLTIEGAAADAKAVGDIIEEIESAISGLIEKNVIRVTKVVPVSGSIGSGVSATIGCIIPAGVTAKVTISTDISYDGDKFSVQHNDNALFTTINQKFSGHQYYDAPVTYNISYSDSLTQNLRVELSEIESATGNITITFEMENGTSFSEMENVAYLNPGINRINPKYRFDRVEINASEKYFVRSSTANLSVGYAEIHAGETLTFNRPVLVCGIVNSLFDGTFESVQSNVSQITNSSDEDAYVAFSITPANFANLIAVSGDYASDYVQYNPMGGYTEKSPDRTYGTISMYYPDEGENIKRIDSNQSVNRFRFVHISDTHQSSDTPIKCIGEFTDLSSAKFLTLTGDIVNDNIANDASKTNDQILEMTKPCYICMGNHDVWGDTNPTQRYTKYFNPIAEHNGLDEDISYYAVDFATEHVKCIWLDIYELSTSTPSFQMSSAQINWFLSQLDDAITNSYHVCVFLHQPLTAIDKPVDSFYDTSLLNAPESNLKWILDTINAFQNKETVEFTHNGNTFSHTFTGKGVFVAYFNGHTHYDSVGWLKDYNQFNVTINRFQTSGEAYDMVYRNEKLRITANYVAIDTYARRLSVVRVGNNNTIAGIKRDAFTVIY